MGTGKKILLFFLAALAVTLFIGLLLAVRFNIKGHFEGLYLLHEKATGKYEVADHLFVGEGTSLIYGKDLTLIQQNIISKFVPGHSNNKAHLHLEWNSPDGNGLVSQHSPDGTILVTYFGRYLDDDKEVHGLFVGGGLPSEVISNTNYNMNKSGMTYFDGKRWYHIWCSVNEGIGPFGSDVVFTPSQWKFLGSRVVSRSESRVVITSSHTVVIDGSPLLIERTAEFTAGKPFFDLEIRIANTGANPVYYQYVYGDEPWVGYYGTSLGDVGWVKDRLISYEETIDSNRYSYAGMADLGNRVIGEQPVYTNLANFIEWFGEEKPEVSISNGPGIQPVKGKRVPLDSNERFIGLRWQRGLSAGSVATIRLAVGMAGKDPKTGLPIKPETGWH